MTLATALRLQLGFDYATTVGGESVSTAPKFNVTGEMATGVVIDTADTLWFNKARALAATSEEIDVAASLSDAFGTTLSFVKIKGVFIQNLSVVADETIKVGGAAANALLLFDDATDIYTIGPGGIFFLWEPSLAGKTVTAATGDLLKIDSGAATLTYNIAIWGTSS